MNPTLSIEVWERYHDHAKKININLKQPSHEDNWWLLESWDFNGLEVVKIVCTKCCKKIRGDNGKHNKINFPL
jgi:hypothetical protein